MELAFIYLEKIDKIQYAVASIIPPVRSSKQQHHKSHIIKSYRATSITHELELSYPSLVILQNGWKGKQDRTRTGQFCGTQ